MKKLLKLMAVAIMFVSIVGCAKQEPREDVVVLYTNDVHAGIADNVGYAGLAYVKNEVQQTTKYVSLVDVGDAVQGDFIAVVTKGEAIVDIMNQLGYEFAVFGNHEFDYGMEQLSKLVEKSNAQYLASNITYTGNGVSPLEKTKPYKVVKYGPLKVGFVGVSTPESIVKSTPTYFMEDGKYVYSFGSETKENFYSMVQDSIDKCLKEKADYVIVLSHLGTDEASAPYTSIDLINNTTGASVVLDGHSHSTIESTIVQDKNGNDVLLSSTGTKLENIGKLTISKDGTLQTQLLQPENKDETINTLVESMLLDLENKKNEVMFTSEVDLLTKDENGIRLVRSRETQIGNLCADAYRQQGQADIGMVNGGGIRADINKGDITYGNVISVHPFGNMLTVVEATGQQILDALEMSSRSCEKDYFKGTEANGENGGFLNVSGLKYTIDTSIKSSVVINDKNEFVEVAGDRRVKDVMVLNQDGQYESLDPNKTYTVASHDYMLKSGGDGLVMFKGNKLLMDASKSDYQVLIDYIDEALNGTITADKYGQIEERIIVK